jgi:hypothetical protein
MSNLLSFTAVSILLAASLQAVAEPGLYQASSPDHRTAMLELYTSEGCSSCPPADQWIAGLKENDSVVPLAFHVTYWDYIGWKDRFADERYDDRQRDIGRYNSSRTVYTPQFVLNGKDYRSYSRFSQDIGKVTNQPAPVDLKVSASLGLVQADVKLSANIEHSPVKDIALYLAVYENNLASQVSDGENAGVKLHHDFVVRQLYGPFIQSQPGNQESFTQTLELAKNWKREDLNLAVFAQNPHSGEILQVVKLALTP